MRLVRHKIQFCDWEPSTGFFEVLGLRNVFMFAENIVRVICLPGNSFLERNYHFIKSLFLKNDYIQNNFLRLWLFWKRGLFCWRKFDWKNINENILCLFISWHSLRNIKLTGQVILTMEFRKLSGKLEHSISRLFEFIQ